MVHSLTFLILKRKNVLSKIWLAAHWDKKLTRYHILQIDIEKCIRDIIHQEIILDLRLSGHLLVGIVKIFSRKTIYLLNECTEIISKVRAFRTNETDLDPRKLVAPLKAITLPEIFEKVDDLELKKMAEDGIFESNQSQVEDITLKEVAHDTRLINDDEHFDIFGEENVPMDFEENIQLASLLNDGEDKEYCNGGEIGNGSFGSSDSLPDKKRVCHMSDSQDLIPLWLTDKKPKTKDDNKLNLEPLTNNFYINQRLKKQKRKLIVDEVKSISREKIETQVQNFSDLVVPLDLAPPSKRLMILKEIGSAEQLLHQPGLKMTSTEIQNLFKRNLRIFKTEEIVEDSTSSEATDISIPLEVPLGKLFGDGCALANDFDEQNFLSCELTNQHKLLNGDALPENAMNSDSSINDFEFFNEQRNAAEEMQLSVEFQQLQVVSKLEMLAVICFLWVKRCNCTEIYRPLHEVYGENAVSLQDITKWCNMFESCCTDTDAERKGRPSIVTNSDVAAHVNESTISNRRMAVDEIANKLDISDGSVHKITMNHFEFCKVCA
ncbi:Double-strand-break repair protein rad21-like protein 1 [Araneus ventricosus]|uniref:Double-strand-break repair protein rad21-like protein 1 n=1 Tax=Araneus ventricosus TaxID=182803 RepID=A0A4Y2N8G8_ARAVE|nr:Double-strand-break repair protein rad21-like protein 1 [Araneus ventricosus]